MIKSHVLEPTQLKAHKRDDFTYHHSYSHDNLPNFCGATVALTRDDTPGLSPLYSSLQRVVGRVLRFFLTLIGGLDGTRIHDLFTTNEVHCQLCY